MAVNRFANFEISSDRSIILWLGKNKVLYVCKLLQRMPIGLWVVLLSNNLKYLNKLKTPKNAKCNEEHQETFQI